MSGSREDVDFLLAECAHFDLLRVSEVTIAQLSLLRNIQALQSVGVTRLA